MNIFLNLTFIKFLKHLNLFKCFKSLTISFWGLFLSATGPHLLVGPSGLEPPTSCLSGTRSNHLSYEPLCTWFLKDRLVEMMGFEPMTPCLQGRCSPSWATPPNVIRDFACFSVFKRSFKIEQRTQKTSLSRLTTNIVFLLVSILHRKEVIQPHLPIRLPCYDLTPIIEPTFGHCLLAVSAWTSGVPNFHGLTGGVYKARERIHRGMLIRDY